MKYIYILLLLFVSAGCNTCCESLCTFDEKDITNMYSSYVEEWKKEANSSFDSAEKTVFSVKPQPKPDVVGPDPDPIKCICKGTGIIVQGDDHKTPCPFHSGQQSNVKKDTRILK